ncbi:cation:proton antiporter [Hydromonas duriensis]|uniref:Kef-type potassium/proton antiporter (CPA2 family) n=1 Tax=Hydromonas duriensis TaxID=1527608 RepID=A0A4R6Y5Z4_9BURK|nr:cation:proton antiporter [Hydromonas duriensis]TDR30813.1 Kef-type potassium/proton antiporter (CPA2 family) [Hydromonas duriensis]
MHGLTFLILLLAVTVLGVVLFRLMHLPPVLGYLFVGVLVGPHSFGLLPDTEDTSHLAEFGIVFLMFTIGLEFSLPKLKSMRRVVFGLGGSQLLGTMLVSVLLGFAVNWFLPEDYKMGNKGWFALGGVLAMSSTAILMKVLTERMELDSQHGRNIFGVLLFQDLAVVPLLILIPALANSESNLMVLMGVGLLKAALVLALLLSFGQKPMHAWLTLVAKRRSQELFMLNLFLMTLGFSWLTEMAGLSLALGAFVAGMLISETEFKLQVEEDIQPFKDILLGFFFITMGMQLNLPQIYTQLPLVLITLAVLLLAKFVVIAGLTRVFGHSPGNAVRTALALAPAGEFGLVLLTLTLQYQLVHPMVGQWVLAAMLISMFLTPFILQHADKIVFRITRSEWMLQSLQLTNIVSSTIEAEQHVVIAGFGRSGTSLGRLLREQNMPYIGLDNDPECVQKSVLQGHDVVYGDFTRKDALLAAGVARARALVITYIEPKVALQVLHHVKAINPELPVIVRTLDDEMLEQLQKAGAVAVVPEILEGSLVLASQTLLTAGIAPQDVLAFIAAQRRERYDLLRQHFSMDEPFGVTSSTPDAVEQPEFERQPAKVEQIQELMVGVKDESLWLNQPLDSLPLKAWRVEVSHLVREGEKLDVYDNPVLLEHDVVVFLGGAYDVKHAAQALNGEV